MDTAYKNIGCTGKIQVVFLQIIFLLCAAHFFRHFPVAFFTFLSRTFPHAFLPDMAQASTAGTRPIPQVAHPGDAVEQFRTFVEIVRVLRTDCPWDRKQTHKSLTPLLIEETYEAVEAAQTQNYTELAKELGDILLHVVMNAVIAEEAGTFTMQSVIAREMEKLIHRHPHVFAGVGGVHSAEDVQKNWEQLKMKEGRTSALEGVPKHLPALLRSQRTQEKAARVGFDWDNTHDVWAKVEEEFAELKEELADRINAAPQAPNNQATRNQARIEEELGDFLFSLVNAARFLGLDAEQTLQNANNKFIHRFQRIEALAKQQGCDLQAMTLAEMDELWNAAKQESKPL